MLKTYLARTKKKTLQEFYRIYDRMADTEMYTEYTHFKIGYENPDYRFEKDEICFIHLPKSAGTSFAKLLTADSKKRFKELLIHRPISLHCPPSEYKYITVMREPVSRVWSLYQMILRHPEGYPYRKHAVRGLEVLLKKDWAARNMVCRYLSGEMKGEPTAETVDSAYKNLQQFYEVIAFDNFGSEASRFLEKHDISFEAIPTERKAKYAEPTPAERALIEKYNQEDIRLFERWQKAEKV